MIYYKVVFSHIFQIGAVFSEQINGKDHMELITSRRNGKITDVVKTARNPSSLKFIIEGEKFTLDLPPDCIDELFVTEPDKYSLLVRKLSEAGKKVYQVTDEVMDRMCISRSGQSILAVVHARATDMPEKMIVCDGVQDPGNAGTIIRTAAALGYGCILSQDSASPYSQKAVQSSAGTVCTCYTERCGAAGAIKKLKQAGYFIISSELDPNAKTPEQLPRPLRTAVIIGSEGRGVSPELSALADEKVYIPIKNTDSLNAAVAAGILMYSLR